ncbi:arginyl-tRNA synthetase [Umbelopsis nana]
MATRVFRDAIARQLSRISGIKEEILESAIEIPKNRKHGEFALPLPKVIASAPAATGTQVEWARQLASKFEGDSLITRAVAIGPFLNFSVHPTEYIRHTLQEVHQKKNMYGMQQEYGRGKSVTIDYSSPNIAKPFHAGHLRSTILGNFVKQVHLAMGYDVVGINYLGDWGKQYGLLAVGFEKYGDESLLEKDPIHHLYDVYVKINQDAKVDAAVDKAANLYFKRMEDGDEQALAQWRKFCQLSIASYKDIYSRLNIEFEQYSGESQVNSYIPRIHQLLNDKGLISKQDDGSLIIDLEQYKLGKPVLQRSDGTSLYLTRDLASLLMRSERFPSDRAIYVVGTEQGIYLKQVFKIAGLLFDQDIIPKQLLHVPFGRIHGMSTRRGTVVFLQDILDTARSSMLDIMKENEEKYQQIMEEYKANKESVDIADVVGGSAVMIQDLAAKRIKDYHFSWKRMTDARGDTGVYLQYAHARLCGIERKAETPIVSDSDTALLKEKECMELAVVISQYPDAVKTAFETLEPCAIVQYLFGLSHAISTANNHLRVKDVRPDLAKARMSLFWAAKTTLANGMRLLGIRPLERM